MHLGAPFHQGCFFRLRVPKPRGTSAGGVPSGPAENASTFFLLAAGLLLSIFAAVGDFGAMGILPFIMIVAGYLIKLASQQFLKKRAPPVTLASGFSVKVLVLIFGGSVMVLSINFVLGYVLDVAFLQPPLSATALASSARYGYAPVYIYTSLFAIAETYLFQGVILYVAYNWLPFNGIFLELFAIALSSGAWMIFHLFVFQTDLLALGFVFFAGMILGFITLYSGNILAASVIHILNNLVAAGLTVFTVSVILLGALM
jgi:membrane protease YdiL (CAAX protease family)